MRYKPRRDPKTLANETTYRLAMRMFASPARLAPDEVLVPRGYEEACAGTADSAPESSQPAIPIPRDGPAARVVWRP